MEEMYWVENKINITVSIPALGNKFDCTVPGNMVIREGIALIIKLVKEEYEELECDIEALQLFHIYKDMFVNKVKTFKDEDICNGSSLVLL